MLFTIALAAVASAAATAGLFSAAAEPAMAVAPPDAAGPREPPASEDLFPCVEGRPRPTC